jgi:hypothetical protein
LPGAAHPPYGVSLYARWLFLGLGANFLELRKCEVRILGILGNTRQRVTLGADRARVL